MERINDIITAPHVLIGGTTGSGKSVLINNILLELIKHGDCIRFILIDPKRVELIQYKKLSFVDCYACELPDIINALKYAIEIMEYRYKTMQSLNMRKYDGKHLYIVIDEIGDLMTQDKKTIAPLIQRIAQLGRAARVHIIAATQSPKREIIPAPLILNFSDRIALRCLSSIESRQILNVAGAEKLPGYGTGLYLHGPNLDYINIPYIQDNIIDAAVNEAINQFNN